MAHRAGVKKNKRDLPCHPDEIRRKIQAINLVAKLQDHIFGTVELTMTQVRSIDILLKKCVPDLTRTLISADLNVRYVAELPKVLTREEWLAKYGTNHLDLKALPAPPASAGADSNGSGNGSLQ